MTYRIAASSDPTNYKELVVSVNFIMSTCTKLWQIPAQPYDFAESSYTVGDAPLTI